MNSTEEEHINQLVDFIAGLARLDFSTRLEFGAEHKFEALAMGLNWLAEELDHSVVSREELEKKNHELEQFAYITSHDLKAPLRAISSLSTFVIEDLEAGDTDSVKEHLMLIKGRVSRLEKLIEGILAYSKLGEQELKKVPMLLKGCTSQ